MKVLIFMTQFYQLSGAERLAIELAEELNKRGIHADILSMYTGDLPGVAEAKKDLLQKGIPAVHFLGMRIHPPIISIFPAIMKLRRLIREHDFDVVETSMVSPTVIASLATMRGRARHVVGLHHVFRRDRENEMIHKFFRFSVRCNRGTRYYAISDYAAKHWITYSKTPPKNTCRIYNAIPDKCFEVNREREGVRKELGIPEEGRLAIYVGRLASYKGIGVLLNALGPVLSKHKIYLLYSGLPDLSVNGTKGLLQHMETLILQNGWGDNVRFLGYRKDVPRLLASADVLVHPTFIEGFGLVLAEAIAAGLPVVASNVEGIPEVLAGTDSIMVSPNDPEALREAVLKTLNRMPDEAAKAIEKGRIRAQDFRINKRTDAMINLFEEVLSGRF